MPTFDEAINQKIEYLESMYANNISQLKDKLSNHEIDPHAYYQAVYKMNKLFRDKKDLIQKVVEL